MNHGTIATIVSLSMIVAMAPGLSADEATPPAEEEIVGAYESPDGIEYITDRTEVGIDGEQSCHEEAPVGFYCDNGDHVRDGYLIHYCRAEEGYTGTVETRLLHEGGERVFACVFEDGALQSTDGYGDWPSSGDELQHDCFSYETGTAGVLYVEQAGLVAMQPTGVPGGAGAWSCAINA